MNEKPILFSAEMVRAILEDRKTQTRRVMKPQPVKDEYGFWTWAGAGWSRDDVAPVMPGHSMANRCPFGQIGDRLWVRETWAGDDWTGYAYKATEPDALPFGEEVSFNKWKPSIFMPRSASRISLEIVNVRVERLQKITLADIEAEGTPPAPNQMMYRNDGYQRYKDFKYLWNKINLLRGFSWESNPWVWVIAFKQDPNWVCSHGHDMRG